MATIIDSFDMATEALIQPQNTVSRIDNFPKIAVVCFGERVIKALPECYSPKQIDELVACVTIPIYQVTCEGKAVAIYCSIPGGPAAAALFEEMIARGCKKFVFFGSCGVLNEKIAAKSLIVPTAAYRDEGTSYHYAPPSEYIDIPTAQRLAEILTELNLPHICGKTWSTDAIYRETRGNMEKRKDDGCLTVEMECASIMAVAQFRGVDLYQFLYAADNLDAEEWDARTLNSLPQESREKFLSIALKVAVRV